MARASFEVNRDVASVCTGQPSCVSLSLSAYWKIVYLIGRFVLKWTVHCRRHGPASAIDGPGTRPGHVPLRGLPSSTVPASPNGVIFRDEHLALLVLLNLHFILEELLCSRIRGYRIRFDLDGCSLEEIIEMLLFISNCSNAKALVGLSLIGIVIWRNGYYPWRILYLSNCSNGILFE